MYVCICIHIHIYICTYIHIYTHTHIHMGFPAGSVVKNLPANPGDMGFIPGSRRSLGEGNILPGKSHGQRSLVGYS